MRCLDAPKISCHYERKIAYVQFAHTFSTLYVYSYIITWVCIMRRRINVRAVRYISLKFHYFSNFASIVQLVPAY
jgi:hypothetical protein